MKQIQRGLVPVMALVSVNCSEASAPVEDITNIISPTGRIAFVSLLPNVGGYVYIANADGSGLRQLPGGPGNYTRPRWSPDRRRIVVSRWDANQESSIYVMDVDGPFATYRLGNGAHPAWSPDGSKIVFASSGGPEGGTGIYVMNADGGDVQRLTYPNDPSRCSEGSSANDLKPDWSPDGRKILFERQVHVDDNFDYDCGIDGYGYVPNVYVMNADGTGAARLRSESWFYADADPAWSPDGRSIAFSIYHDALYVIDSEGTGPLQRFDVSGIPLSPTWSPDGKKLLFLNANPPANQLVIVDIATGETKVLTFPTVPGVLLDPAWSR